MGRLTQGSRIIHATNENSPGRGAWLGLFFLMARRAELFRGQLPRSSKECGGNGLNRSPHNCLDLYQLNRFRSELVAQTNAGVVGRDLVHNVSPGQSAVGGGQNVAIYETARLLRVGNAGI
jgi:hypothetical protein